MVECDILLIPLHWVFYFYMAIFKGIAATLSIACQEILLLLIICNLLKLEPIIGVENFMFWDTKKQTNIIACFKFTDTTLHDIKDIIIQRVRDLKRTRAYDIIVNLGGFLFFKRIKSIDLTYHIKTIDNLFNEEPALLDYCKKIVNTEWNMQKPLWECYISQVSYGNCYVIFRYHHSVADGMSALINILNGFENFNGTPQKLMSVSIYVKLYMYVAFPFYCIQSLIKLIWRRDKKFWMQDNGNKSNNKSDCAVSSDLDLEKVKKISKEAKCKVNDVILHFIIGAIAGYQSKKLIKQGNKKVKEISIATYISVREEMGKYYDIPMDNRISGLIDIYPISSGSNNMTETLKEISEINYTNKAGFSHLGIYYGSFWLRWILPAAIGRKIMRYLINLVSICYSNIAGPDYSLQYANTKITSMFAILPNYMQMPCSICVISYNNKLKVSCSAISEVMDAKLFIKEIDELMSKY